jgi:ATP-dependent Clp protease protease subunit
MKNLLLFLFPLCLITSLVADEVEVESVSDSTNAVLEPSEAEPVETVDLADSDAQPMIVAEAVSDDSEKDELAELRKERERLQLKNALAQEQMRHELSALSEERARLEAANALAREQLQSHLLKRRQALELLDVEIEEATKAAQLLTVTQRAELHAELAELRMEEDRLKAHNALAQQQLEKTLVAMREMDAKVKMERQEIDLRLARVNAEIQFREASDIYRDRIPREQEYVLDVFDGSRLFISDRRIPLNGPIWGGTADHVQQRIDYFNNQNSDYPIFIVIDYSPGGSVMAGYRILKAMEGSQAPVYVVVRSFAASMAATITTLAEKSFAYPNAIILHHQVMWGGFGNLTQQRERLKETEEWWQRLATPIAEKMGISLDEFVEQMYKRFSDGDWREFADKAVELNWVDHIVSEITERSIDRNPDRFELPSAYALDLKQQVDDKGNPFVVLPRLAPFDYWHLYNPDGFYR